jgi:hypothetical protein
MVMSYLLPYYQQPWIDNILTAHAQRNFNVFHLDLWDALMAGLTYIQFVNLIEYVQSWGFKTSCWLTSSSQDRRKGWESVKDELTKFFMYLTASVRDKFIALPGEELNNGCPPGSSGADSIIANTCGFLPDVPVYLHFTSNYPGYPPPPPDGNIDAALVVWWQQWIGKVQGLCWQGNQDNSAGLMGSKMYDARRILARSDSSFKLVAFETLATNLLNGVYKNPDGSYYSEEEQALRGWEMLCCPMGDSNQMIYGAAGARYPNGNPI